MNLNLHYKQCDDDWGWFIDTETADTTNNILLQPCRPYVKKFNSCLNKLLTIDEDEYEYYQKNYKDLEEKYDVNLKSLNEIRVNDINKNENRNINSYMFSFSSTTLITAVLTYVIFIIL